MLNTSQSDDSSESYYDHTCSGTGADGTDCGRGVKGLRYAGNIDDQYCHDHEWQKYIAQNHHPRVVQALPTGETLCLSVYDAENEDYEWGVRQRVETQYGTLYANEDKFDKGIHKVRVRRSASDWNQLILQSERVGDINQGDI